MKVTKEDLLNLAADKMKIRDLKQEIEDIKEAAAIAAYQYSITPSSKGPQPDVMADKVDKLITCKNEWADEQLRFVEHNRAVIDRITRLRNPYYVVMWKRYMENCSWRKIARSMNYSESAVRKIHARALVLLQAGD